MRQKELRVALICYGGISLAVYMHGVTKEIWRATRASRGFLRGDPQPDGVEGVYRRLLETIERERELRVRVLTDVVAGASAGGINGVFLAQAISSGQSLEPLTRLWLEKADVDEMLDPDARPFSRFTKVWAQPLVWYMLGRPGNVVSSTVAPDTRDEVRAKVSRLIRARWFEPPFSGIGFSRLIDDAFAAMAADKGDGAPLLPDGHPLDLFVTTTDFNGHAETLRLHSPPLIEESEHRLTIGFRRNAARSDNRDMAARPELVLAARATASFPGAFPPLQIAEIDRLADERGLGWPERAAFLKRVMPEHARRDEIEMAALIDGAILINAPFSQAIGVLRDRPAEREVDRRIVYIDPKPERSRLDPGVRAKDKVGFFSVIFGALSVIPREQPIRDNLEAIHAETRERKRLRAVVDSLRPEVEEAVEHLFGRTFFFDRPTPKRLAAWRNKAQHAAAERADYSFHAYAQLKAEGIVAHLAELIVKAAPDLSEADEELVAERLWEHLREQGLGKMGGQHGGAAPEAVAFFRTYDVGFRIRRLRLLARRLAHDWEDLGEIEPEPRELARDAVFRALSLYFAIEPRDALGPDLAEAASRVKDDPGPVLAIIAERRALSELDEKVDGLLIAAMDAMSQPLRRRTLLAYLGFPFYDVATLPLLRGEGLTEFDPLKVDRISPDDCTAIRKGGSQACLRGTEFFSFGAFFSRAYRENDYLWGRLHGAERMIDMITSTVERPLPADRIAEFKREAFLAILHEERDRLHAEPNLVGDLVREVAQAFRYRQPTREPPHPAEEPTPSEEESDPVMR